MTNRLIAAFQSLLVLASLRLGPSVPPPSALDLPEPRVRLDEAYSPSDAWLFDGAASGHSAEAYVLNQAMSRTAGALAQLRGLLSQMSQALPAPEAPMAARSIFDSAPADPVLFDEVVLAHSDRWVSGAADGELFDALPEFFPRAARDDQGLLRVA